MDSIYRQIRPFKVSEEIVQQIKSLIKEGKLQPGEALPPERIFAEMLGVGRSSIREAINILETLGFIEIKKRIGVFVRSVSEPIITNPLRQILEEDDSKFYELYEFRKDIELASTYKAARFRTDRDLYRMKKVLEKMEHDCKKLGISVKDDLAFHLGIAQATQNFMRAHILKSVWELSEDYMELGAMKIREEKGGAITIYNQHKRIFLAIQQRDQEAARSRMEEHLSWVEIKWKEFGKKPSDNSGKTRRRVRSTSLLLARLPLSQSDQPQSFYHTQS